MPNPYTGEQYFYEKTPTSPITPITPTQAPAPVVNAPTVRNVLPQGSLQGTMTQPKQGSLTAFSSVMRAISEDAYDYRQKKEGKITGKQFDPTKVSGSIFKDIMGAVESRRGAGISKMYGGAVDAARFDIEEKEKKRQFDIEQSQKKEEFYASHPELNYGFSTGEGMRTDRHNNPTAFTTDIAKQAGLIEGVDYVMGDPFPENPNMFTAKLLGNPIESTIRVIDKIGFVTQNGQNRWVYTDSIPGANNAEWLKLGFSEKAQIIKDMYRNEGGNGSLFGLTAGEKALTTQQVATVKSISGSFDSEQIVKTFNKGLEANNFVKALDPNSENPADDQALIYSFAKAMDPDSVVREGEYATVQKYSQSWAESFGYNALRVANNQEFLTSEARENIKMTIQRKFEAQKKSYDNLFEQYTRRINELANINDGSKYLTQYSFNAMGEVNEKEIDVLKNKYNITY